MAIKVQETVVDYLLQLPSSIPNVTPWKSAVGHLMLPCCIWHRMQHMILTFKPGRMSSWSLHRRPLHMLVNWFSFLSVLFVQATHGVSRSACKHPWEQKLWEDQAEWRWEAITLYGFPLILESAVFPLGKMTSDFAYLELCSLLMCDFLPGILVDRFRVMHHPYGAVHVAHVSLREDC